MKILKLLNKKLLLIKLVCLIFFTPAFAEEKPIDIWNIEKKDNQVISETNISSENSSGTTQNSVYELQTNKQTDTVKLDKEPIIEYLKSNITLLRWMISEGYSDAKTLERRARAMEKWIENPVLMSADKDAEYAAVIDIPLEEIDEPLLCCPNDPDDIKPLSEVANTKIQEVFIGSCMTNIGHFRAAGKLLKDTSSLPTRLWISPPTRMDKFQLEQEGFYDIFKKAGVRTEVPGCSLCMGNQARVEPNATVVSTSTRNFPNRLGDGADVYLASAELAAISSILGKLPTNDEYQSFMSEINTMSADIFRYMNFNEIKSYKDAADNAKLPAVTIESN